ncbi:hypothetical protein QBC35DRAFT_222925 [Podospora australis]|uniref:Uncharacterized protein n=1 Tax=Podospora australis TaxID=1536484 RepID=A0AAN7AMC9_9PEZI|nr:hypothetical protein QBC35DRAFT_222925 [Podospora australis]
MDGWMDGLTAVSFLSVRDYCLNQHFLSYYPYFTWAVFFRDSLNIKGKSSTPSHYSSCFTLLGTRHSVIAGIYPQPKAELGTLPDRSPLVEMPALNDERGSFDFPLLLLPGFPKLSTPGGESSTRRLTDLLCTPLDAAPDCPGAFPLRMEQKTSYRRRSSDRSPENRQLGRDSSGYLHKCRSLSNLPGTWLFNNRTHGAR